LVDCVEALNKNWFDKIFCDCFVRGMVVGVPPHLLIIGLIIGIPLLLWLLSEGLAVFVGAVVHAIYVIFGGKPTTS
jgi:hypothetical protein